MTGMQGDDPHYYRAISTPKHFAVHSGPEPTRHLADVDVSKHDLEDTYLPAFRAAVVEGHAGSVMCAYNARQRRAGLRQPVPAAAHAARRVAVQGYVVSDCGAVARHLARAIIIARRQPKASAISLMRGMDNECLTFGDVTGDDDYRPLYRGDAQGYLPQTGGRHRADATVHGAHAAGHVRSASDGPL